MYLNMEKHMLFYEMACSPSSSQLSDSLPSVFPGLWFLGKSLLFINTVFFHLHSTLAGLQSFNKYFSVKFLHAGLVT